MGINNSGQLRVTPVFDALWNGDPTGEQWLDSLLTVPRRIVIEGKFTEPHPTTKTTWMSERHQMLRHIDAAWDSRGARTVLGFFILDDPDARGWKDAAARTISHGAIAGSLPHRDEKTQREIASSFLGVTTWAEVVRETKLQLKLKPAVSLKKE